MASGKAEATPPVSTLTKAKAFDNLWKIKESVAILLGILLGVIPLKSYFGFPIYLILQFLAAKLYVYLYRVPQHVLNFKEILLESTFTSLASFVLSWIVTYSFMWKG